MNHIETFVYNNAKIAYEKGKSVTEAINSAIKAVEKTSKNGDFDITKIDIDHIINKLKTGN